MFSPPPCPWPNVRAFIERQIDGVLHLVIQERRKPNEPPLLELPGGSLEKYEPLLECLRREVFEETGLRITQILDDPERVAQVNQGDHEAECVRPFAAYQTLRGTFPSMGVYFRCHADGELLSQGDGAANARWVSIHELTRLVAEEPDALLTFELAGIRQWLKFHGADMWS